MSEELKRKTYSFADLEKTYEGLTISVQAHCRLITALVGGQPSTRTGVEAFVKWQLKLTGAEAAEAVERILHHEIEGGTRAIQVPEDAELEESETKSVNLIRRDVNGPWIGDWMVS